ncbi:MAG: hypothetical protein QOF31_334 [Mycobacterium sp.]|jgi:hypothetical protein|nr:hypothetical protein [Mycobacterium sp.]
MATLDRESVLDELEVLATIEHALIVEYLSICCALGNDLDAKDGGPTTDRGRAAAAAAAQLAQGEMIHFRDINRALVNSKRSARLDRAERIANMLVPPDQTELQRLLEREKAIAMAVDERYTRLAPAVTTHPVFEGERLNEWRIVIVGNGPTHVDGLTELQTALDDRAPRSSCAPPAQLRTIRSNNVCSIRTTEPMDWSWARSAGRSIRISLCPELSGESLFQRC